jgi:predicted MFS family arabinose efflux permease
VSFLIAVGAFLATLVGGIVLYLVGLEVVGIVVALASIPCALAAWVTSADRRA